MQNEANPYSSFRWKLENHQKWLVFINDKWARSFFEIMDVKVPEISGIPDFENAQKPLILYFHVNFGIKTPTSCNPDMVLSHACWK